MIKSGATAADWATQVSQIVGGKAGGKGNTSQGIGSSPEKVEDAVEIARKFMENLAL